MRHVGDESVECVEKGDRADLEHTHSEASGQTGSSPIQPDESEAPQQRDI